MRAYEEQLEIPSPPAGCSVLEHLREHLRRRLPAGVLPIRFVVHQITAEKYICEIGVLEGAPDELPSAMNFVPGRTVDSSSFTVALVVPTGVGAEIGGHAGDAGPAAILLGSVCDRLVTHPNTVNASELNEMPANAQYVEGSVLSRLMMGTVALQPSRANRILFVVDQHADINVTNVGINLFNGARASCGYDGSSVMVQDRPFTTTVDYSKLSGRATGQLDNLHFLIEALRAHRDHYDAIAINTQISGLTSTDMLNYVQGGTEGVVNPIGGAEAMLTHAISTCLDVPSAHSPQLYQGGWWGNVGLVEPTMAAEPACIAFVQCILKGLHRSPRIVTDSAEMNHREAIGATDVNCLVTPDRCVGLPLLAALERGTKVIAVRDNYNVMKNDLGRLPWRPGQLHFVENYLEAAGLVAAFRAGVAAETVRRPLHMAPIVHVSALSSSEHPDGTDDPARSKQPVPRSAAPPAAAPASPPISKARSGTGNQGSDQDRIEDWNRTESPLPPECIHQLFAAQVERTPNSIAVIDGDVQVTYRQLADRCNRLAHYLSTEHGVAPGDVVGLCLERSLDAIVGLIAALKAQAAYVGLEPNQPAARLAAILEDCQPKVILTGKAHQSLLGSRWSGAVCLEDAQSRIDAQPTSDPESTVDHDSLAFVLYTSGSTGTPKGVLGRHGCIVNRVLWEHHDFEDGEVLCQKTALGFIDHLWETFAPLVRGLSLVVMPHSTVRDLNAMVALLAKHRVTRFVVAPSLMQALLDAKPDLASQLPDLKYWVSSSETMSVRMARQFQLQLPSDRVLINIYGTSETWEISWEKVAVASGSKRVSVGRPVANMKCYIVDDALKPVPIGEAGELCVAGVGLAAGYLNAPELTAEKFVPNPFDSKNESKLYRTGDRAMFHPDGRIELIGRVDDQVQIRGNRVEPGEVQLALEQHHCVEAVAVVARQDWQQQVQLVAYCVPKSGRSISAVVLRDFLRERFPEPMIPSAFVALEALPFTSRGKLDRSALPEPSRKDAYVPPENDTETAIAAIWEELLGVEPIGRSDFFFDLGGDSLLAMSTVARIGDKFGVAIDINQLIQNPQLGDFASLVDHLRSLGTARRQTAIPRRGRSSRSQ